MCRAPATPRCSDDVSTFFTPGNSSSAADGCNVSHGCEQGGQGALAPPPPAPSASAQPLQPPTTVATHHPPTNNHCSHPPISLRTALVIVAETSTQRAGSSLLRTAARIALTCKARRGGGSDRGSTTAKDRVAFDLQAGTACTACTAGTAGTAASEQLPPQPNARDRGLASGPKPRSNMVSASSSTTTSTSP